jgi:hypothetical protein
MPRKKTKAQSKKKVFIHDTDIETGFRSLEEGDHRIPIRGREAAPPDIWENEIEGIAGKAKSDLPYGLPTDDLHFDSNRIVGVRPPYAPDKKTVEAARHELEPRATKQEKGRRKKAA